MPLDPFAQMDRVFQSLLVELPAFGQPWFEFVGIVKTLRGQRLVHQALEFAAHAVARSEHVQRVGIVGVDDPQRIAPRRPALRRAFCQRVRARRRRRSAKDSAVGRSLRQLPLRAPPMTSAAAQPVRFMTLPRRLQDFSWIELLPELSSENHRNWCSLETPAASPCQSIPARPPEVRHRIGLHTNGNAKAVPRSADENKARGCPTRSCLCLSRAEFSFPNKPSWQLTNAYCQQPFFPKFACPICVHPRYISRLDLPAEDAVQAEDGHLKSRWHG